MKGFVALDTKVPILQPKQKAILCAKRMSFTAVEARAALYTCIPLNNNRDTIDDTTKLLPSFRAMLSLCNKKCVLKREYFLIWSCRSINSPSHYFHWHSTASRPDVEVGRVQSGCFYWKCSTLVSCVRLAQNIIQYRVLIGCQLADSTLIGYFVCVCSRV